MPGTVSRTTHAEEASPRNAGPKQAPYVARSIADVLDMTVSEAIAFFVDYPDVVRGLKPLTAVGLEYLKLGQPVPT